MKVMIEEERLRRLSWRKKEEEGRRKKSRVEGRKEREVRLRG